MFLWEYLLYSVVHEEVVGNLSLNVCSAVFSMERMCSYGIVERDKGIVLLLRTSDKGIAKLCYCLVPHSKVLGFHVRGGNSSELNKSPFNPNGDNELLWGC